MNRNSLSSKSKNLSEPPDSFPHERLVERAQWLALSERWNDVLGEGNVQFAQDLEPAIESADPSPCPIAILKPSSVDEVVRLVELARDHQLPIYPISKGKNWGYGGSAPVANGQAKLDLSRMNRIHEINEELGYAIVEPGVTQGQLAEVLTERNSRFMLDVTGAGPEASIVGNTLERGFGHTPYGDHFAHSCNMQVVLPSGEVIETGFGAYENAKTKNVFPWGLGPWVDGLFSQSNLGIVTRMTVWLMPRPAKIEAFAIRLVDDADLAEVINCLRELRLQGTLKSTVHVANDLRVISALMGCPGQDQKGRAPLTLQQRKKLQDSTATGAWNVLGAIYGDRKEVRYIKSRIRKTLGTFAKPLFFDQRRIDGWAKLGRLVGGFAFAQSHLAKLASAESALDLLSGVPTPEHLRGAFWRNGARQNSIEDPAKAGLLWLSPVIPMTGNHAERIVGLIDEEMNRHGFDTLLTLTSINERAMCCVLSINYDRSDIGESKIAMQCYKAIWNRILEAGYPPYRAGIKSMAAMTAANSNDSLLGQIKSAIDPEGIFAPGRYIG